MYPHQEKFSKKGNGRDLVTGVGRGWVRMLAGSLEGCREEGLGRIRVVKHRE